MTMFAGSMMKTCTAEEELADSPSRRDGIEGATENILRLFGSTLIQKAANLLDLSPEVAATGMIFFQRFYINQSFGRFHVNTVAASCTWLASKFKENPRKASQVVLVFHRMDCGRKNKNLPTENLDINSDKFAKLKSNLVITERWVLKELGFNCLVEYPDKLVATYLSTLEAQELAQEAWRAAKACLCTTLCVRFEPKILACGVIYAAARRCQVQLPENPPWWEMFRVDKSDIDEICRVLAIFYGIRDVKHIPVYGDSEAFTLSSKSLDLPPHASLKEGFLKANITRETAESAATLESAGIKEVMIKAGINNLKENGKIGDDSVIRSLDRNVRVHNVSGKKTEPTKKRKIEETVSKSCSQYRFDDVRGSRCRIDDVRGERNKKRQWERRERLRL